ncbi:MAG: ROK family protein [Phycisphaeraceae bacterium]|nr:ROK family protein [Phycisphaeraceae bacterium]
MTERARKGPVAGIDLGGTNMNVGIVDDRGKVIGRCKRKTKAVDGKESVIARLVEAIDRATSEAGLSRSQLAAVGVGAPSAIDMARGVMLNAGNLGWKNVPLRDILSKRLARPVVVDNDVNVAAWGEHVHGAGRGRGDMLAVWVGTGIGGGLVLNGKLWRGPLSTAGEIGNSILLPINSPGRRSVEEHCSRTAMVRAMETLLGFYPNSMLHEFIQSKNGREPLDRAIGSSVIAECYAKGDALVRRVVDGAADLLGVAIANAVTLLSIPTVILGGGVTEALGKTWIARVRDSFEEHVFPQSLRQVNMVASTLEDDAGILGAAMLARDPAMTKA